MKLKNYQEDVVLRAIEIALEPEPDMLRDEDFVKDVAAFVLNRVPPRYVMSERGFLRLALEHLEEEQQDKSLANVIELMMLVNRGVDLVRRRRTAAGVQNGRDAAVGGVTADRILEYVHNYPQIIGRVTDSEARSVYGATVSLVIGGEPAPPAAGGWQNPYVTREQTRGHFCFWPQPARSGEPELTVDAVFVVDHPDYAPYRHVETITTEGSYDAAETILADKVLSLTPFVLSANGVSEGAR